MQSNEDIAMTNTTELNDKKYCVRKQPYNTSTKIVQVGGQFD